ncbi:hypothetical protein EVAR_257_1 [Eumeta japonica]|uniref:Uncharacterized protein n=1 Tax=Eumeta variegata TaxID=151549 RepID=A0A4C1SCH0_EUMVA|nr:hypothetical protein EVAR_257_1 [Eumeta japonica]
MDLNGDLDLDVQRVLSNPPENSHRKCGVNNNPSRKAKNTRIRRATRLNWFVTPATRALGRSLTRPVVRPERADRKTTRAVSLSPVALKCVSRKSSLRGDVGRNGVSVAMF